ncbi:hypothetical protein Dimus_017073 [Dionaea muscipula]
MGILVPRQQAHRRRGSQPGRNPTLSSSSTQPACTCRTCDSVRTSCRGGYSTSSPSPTTPPPSSASSSRPISAGLRRTFRRCGSGSRIGTGCSPSDTSPPAPSPSPGSRSTSAVLPQPPPWPRCVRPRIPPPHPAPPPPPPGSCLYHILGGCDVLRHRRRLRHAPGTRLGGAQCR